jgi:hypothetical protein
MVYFLNLFGSINTVLSGKPTILGYTCLTIIAIRFFYQIYKEQSIDAEKTPIQMTIKNLALMVPKPISYYFLLILYYLLCLAIAVFSVNISSIMVIIYFWIHSLFGMALYGSLNIREIIRNIDNYVDSDLYKFKVDDKNYKESNLFERFIYFLMVFLHKNVYLFGYLILLVTSVYQSVSSIYSNTLNQVVCALIMVQIIIVCLFMSSSIPKKKSDGSHESDNAKINFNNDINEADINNVHLEMEDTTDKSDVD